MLDRLGVGFETLRVSVDERLTAGEGPGDYVERLARAKAAAGLAHHPDHPVLGADTTVVVDGQVLGKPRDAADGRSMLMALSNRSHQVLTGVALATAGGIDYRVSISTVRFRPIAPEEAEAYWHTGEPADKAGGYAIQGVGAIFVERLDGSYSGVMGLPIFETAQLLAAVGIAPLSRATP